MNPSTFTHGTGTGTACGTLLVILSNIHWGDILQTSLLAAIGASVSFIVTLAWKRFLKKKK